MLISRVRKEVSHSDWLFVGKLKGETIRKLMGGGGGGEVEKKYSRKGKLNEKNSCNPKKYLCYGLKAIHSRTLIRKKKFLRLENSPPPPDNFSNGPFLRLTHEPCLGITS